MTDSVPFHVGYIVSDLDEAMASYTKLGVELWVTSGWRAAPYFDAGAGKVTEPMSRVAYGKLNDTMSIEFIEVDPSGPVPLVWTMATTGFGTPHVGHWVRSPKQVAQRLIREGARLVLAKVSSPEIEALTEESTADPDAMPDNLDTCYLATPAGLLIELVPTSIWNGRLISTFGDRTHEAIVAPPAEFLPAPDAS
ncbi:MAG: Glyoxalase/Bleomycin resistance protein/Dioxygenase superfamily [Pseudonocardiales bacterium]|nr:Glyoxalase/Bleomycin resistance protein/Dioxygenase superfamily [Pseudonocardiales bacterium]